MRNKDEKKICLRMVLKKTINTSIINTSWGKLNTKSSSPITYKILIGKFLGKLRYISMFPKEELHFKWKTRITAQMKIFTITQIHWCYVGNIYLKWKGIHGTINKSTSGCKIVALCFQLKNHDVYWLFLVAEKSKQDCLVLYFTLLFFSFFQTIISLGCMNLFQICFLEYVNSYTYNSSI